LNKWVIDQQHCPEPPSLESDAPDLEFETPEPLEPTIVKTKTTHLPSSSAKKHGRKSLEKNVPPPDYNMEDETVTKNTIQEIQKFFGLTAGALTAHSPNIPQVLERKYSHTLVSSRSEEFSQSNPAAEEAPKNADEAVISSPPSSPHSFSPLLRSPYGSSVKIICFPNLKSLLLSLLCDCLSLDLSLSAL
jgi:hypothetical protein